MCSYEDISKQSFELALNLATKKLSSMKAEEICRNSGATRIDDDHVLIQYLNRPYRVTISTGDVSLKEKEEEVPVKDQILILHYLTKASGVPFTNKLITYSQIEGGKFYCPVFQKRKLEPILKCFGHKPELLLEVAQKLGAQRQPMVMSRWPSTPFPWRGSISSSGKEMTKSLMEVISYLMETSAIIFATEDVCVLTEILVWKFVNLTKKLLPS